MRKYYINTDNRRNCKIMTAPNSDGRQCLPSFATQEFDTEEEASRHLAESVYGWLGDEVEYKISNMNYDTEEEIDAYEKRKEELIQEEFNNIVKYGRWDYDGIYYDVRQFRDED